MKMKGLPGAVQCGSTKLENRNYNLNIDAKSKKGETFCHRTVRKGLAPKQRNDGTLEQALKIWNENRSYSEWLLVPQLTCIRK